MLSYSNEIDFRSHKVFCPTRWTAKSRPKTTCCGVMGFPLLRRASKSVHLNLNGFPRSRVESNLVPSASYEGHDFSFESVTSTHISCIMDCHQRSRRRIVHSITSNENFYFDISILQYDVKSMCVCAFTFYLTITIF